MNTASGVARVHMPWRTRGRGSIYAAMGKPERFSMQPRKEEEHYAFAGNPSPCSVKTAESPGVGL